jgi:hypothetical protein
MSMGTLKWVIDFHLLPIYHKDQGFCDGITKVWIHYVLNYGKTQGTCEKIIKKKCELNRNMLFTKHLMLRCYLENWLKKILATQK